jgi:hypothetical protein
MHIKVPSPAVTLMMMAAQVGSGEACGSGFSVASKTAWHATTQLLS